MDELLEKIPPEYRERFVEIIELTDRFCGQHLNAEYREKCLEIAFVACRCHVPLQRGKPNGWASGVVYAVGFVNFLTDPGTEPYLRAEEIAKGFGVSMATMHAKSRAIRDALELSPFDPRFTLPSLLDENPLVWLVETSEGLIVDVRRAPRELQEEAFRRGLIPYIPGEREQSGEELQRRSQLRSRYQHLRNINRSLNDKLVRRLSRDMILEAGSKLGMLEGDRLDCDPDEELPILLDYALFHLRRNGRNTVEQYLEGGGPDPDERVCLQAMQRSIYSVFVIEQVEPGFGAIVRNLLSHDTFLLADIVLGSTAEEGMMLASRMLFLEEFAMTGGAILPVEVPLGEKRERWIEHLLALGGPDASGFSDPAPVIRECLSGNRSILFRHV